MTEIQNEMLQLGVYALVVRGQGQDLLMGTNVNDFVKVTGLEKLLHLFITDLDHYFSFIYKGDVAGYLNALEDKFSVDLSQLQQNIEVNIQGMKETDSDDIMIHYLVITKTLEYLRKTFFDTVGWDWIKKMYKDETGMIPPKKILNEINRIDAKADINISLLYNLIFVHYIAKIYDEKSVIKSSNDLINKSINGVLVSIKN